MEEITEPVFNDAEIAQTFAHIRHELRTPLNQILGYSELLIEQADEENKPEWKSDLQKIQSAGRRLLQLMALLLSDAPNQLYAAPGTDISGTAKTVTYAAMTNAALLLDPVTAPGARSGNVATRLLELAQDALPVLVVDDEVENREILARLLVRSGFVVDEAPDGETALRKLHNIAYDAVFLDVLMPKMNGLETLQAISAHEILRFTPVIMVSALDDLQTVADCLNAGAQDYLPKPFNITLLQARLAATLERKRLRDHEQDAFAQLAEAHTKLDDANYERGEALQGLIGDLRTALQYVGTNGDAQRLPQDAPAPPT